MKLHISYRSSAASRARIAMNLKGVSYEAIPHQVSQGGFKSSEYLKLNPQGLVPALEDGPNVIVQSVAIIEYLDERFPEPRLLPSDLAERARVRGLAYVVTSDIHPLENLRVLKYLQRELGHDEAAAVSWYNYWIADGFAALEKQLAADSRTGKFCHGDSPTLADICLVPQVFNAHRHDLDLSPFPTIRRIYEAALEMPEFSTALPDNNVPASGKTSAQI